MQFVVNILITVCFLISFTSVVAPKFYQQYLVKLDIYQYIGLYIKNSLVKILHYYAKKGHVKAQYFYANYLISVAESVDDIVKAASWLENPAALGNGQAAYKLALIMEQFDYSFIKNQDQKSTKNFEDYTDKIVDLISKAAKNGHSKSQFKLAMFYWYGEHNLEQDYKLSHDWFTLAARSGNPKALCNLGVMYNRGDLHKDLQSKEQVSDNNMLYSNDENTKEDKEESVSQEHEINQLKQSLQDKQDRLIDRQRDFKKAFEFFTLAKELGDSLASCNLAQMYKRGCYVTKSLAKCFEHYQDAAMAGNIDGMYELARCHQKGIGTKKDNKTAFEWYTKAAALGYTPAKLKLADYYVFDDDIKSNPIKAEYLLKSVAEQGDARAQFKLASFYDSTSSNLQDFKKAYYWYLKSAKQGYTKAQINLAALFLKGEGIAPSEESAMFWLELAAQNGDEVAKYNLHQLKYAKLEDILEQALANNRVLH